MLLPYLLVQEQVIGVVYLIQGSAIAQGHGSLCVSS